MKSVGFTLIELTVVIAVIGILASVALPQYTDYIARTRATEALVLIKPVQEQLVAYYERWGRFPENEFEAGLGDLRAYRGQFTSNLAIQPGVITFLVTDGGEASQVWLQAARPEMAGPVTSVLWLCMKQSAPAGLEFLGNYVPDDRYPPLPESRRNTECRSQ